MTVTVELMVIEVGQGRFLQTVAIGRSVNTKHWRNRRDQRNFTSQNAYTKPEISLWGCHLAINVIPWTLTFATFKGTKYVHSVPIALVIMDTRGRE